MSHDTEIDKLVKHIAVKAADPDTPFAESVDALKALTAYLTVARKHPPAGDTEDVEPSMASLRNEIEDAQHGGTDKVATRNRRRADA